MEATLFSIGHGRKTMEEFVKELVSFDIHFLVDVRSTPYSKWSSHFNQPELKLYLSQFHIQYGYMGDLIGGRPTDSGCYDENGFFDYSKMAKVPSFIRGLNRLLDANNRQLHVAIMCSESDPAECHRSKLIGRELYEQFNIDMKHIIAPRQYKTECQIVTELTHNEWKPLSLFGREPMPTFKSRKSYKTILEPEEELAQ